jgi:hypothetical protein
MYCSPHLFPIHIIYVLIFPIIRDRTPDTNEQKNIPLKVIILSVILELPLSVRGVGRRTQPIRTQRIRWAFVITLPRSSVRTQLLIIFSSETTWLLKTKLWWNGPLVIPFQNCVRFIINGHVGWMSGLPDTILKGGHQRTKQSLVPIGPVVSEMKIF